MDVSLTRIWWDGSIVFQGGRFYITYGYRECTLYDWLFGGFLWGLFFIVAFFLVCSSWEANIKGQPLASTSLRRNFPLCQWIS